MKLVPGRTYLMKKLETSASDTGAGRSKTAFRAEMEMGMVRSWHLRAATVMARAKSAADLNMMSRLSGVGGERILTLDNEIDAGE